MGHHPQASPRGRPAPGGSVLMPPSGPDDRPEITAQTVSCPYCGIAVRVIASGRGVMQSRCLRCGRTASVTEEGRLSVRVGLDGTSDLRWTGGET